MITRKSSYLCVRTNHAVSIETIFLNYILMGLLQILHNLTDWKCTDMVEKNDLKKNYWSGKQRELNLGSVIGIEISITTVKNWLQKAGNL